jgi:threonine synthase
VGRRILGARADDDTTTETIAEVHARLGVVLDPHTAVGYRLVRDHLDRGPQGRRALLLATAHPAKFREVVEPAIGQSVEIPERLARWADRPLQSHHITAQLEELAAILES